MTPSEAHETALSRPAGHDKMQLDILRYLRGDDFKTWNVPSRHGGQPREGVRSGLRAEALYSGRFGVAFADIAMRFEVRRAVKDDYVVDAIHDVIFELKPQIYSPAALLRQLRMLRHKVGQFHPYGEPRNGGHLTQYTFKVLPVVPHDDARLEELRHLIGERFCSWNGANLDWVEPHE